jgi:hypothetical protein
MPLKIEAPSSHFAGVITRQASFANVRPQDVDSARRKDTDVSHKGRTAISVTSHASELVINEWAGNLIEICIIFQ